MALEDKVVEVWEVATSAALWAEDLTEVPKEVNLINKSLGYCETGYTFSSRAHDLIFSS